MRLAAVEDITHRLALVGGERGNLDDRPDLLVGRRPDDRSCVGVPNHHDRTLDSLQGPIKGRHIVQQRGQWQRRRDCPHTLDRNAPITLLQLDPSAQAPREHHAATALRHSMLRFTHWSDSP